MFSVWKDCTSAQTCKFEITRCFYDSINALEQRSSTDVHQIMRGVHHYERVHKGASKTCHTKQILFTKLSVNTNEPFNQPMTQDLT